MTHLLDKPHVSLRAVRPACRVVWPTEKSSSHQVIMLTSTTGETAPLLIPPTPRALGTHHIVRVVRRFVCPILQPANTYRPQPSNLLSPMLRKVLTAAQPLFCRLISSQTHLNN